MAFFILQKRSDNRRLWWKNGQKKKSQCLFLNLFAGLKLWPADTCGRRTVYFLLDISALIKYSLWHGLIFSPTLCRIIAKLLNGFESGLVAAWGLGQEKSNQIPLCADLDQLAETERWKTAFISSSPSLKHFTICHINLAVRKDGSLMRGVRNQVFKIKSSRWFQWNKDYHINKNCQVRCVIGETDCW